MKAVLILGFACVSAVRAASFMGVMVQEIDADRARELKLKEDFGVEVTRVEPDSPAERAGLKVGDAIQEWNGQRVEGMEQFKRLVSETPTGREVKLDMMRGGSAQTVVIKMGVKQAHVAPPALQFPAPPRPVPTLRPDMPQIPQNLFMWRSTVLGFEGESLNGQLAQYFGVNEGVLVRSVNKGSSAEKAGLKAGDVVTRVDDSKVETPADLVNHVRSMRGRQVAMVVMRDRKEITLNLTVEDDDRSEQWWIWPQSAEGSKAGWVQ
jgi:serine protease Do